MSLKVPAFGVVEITIPASAKLALYSKASAKAYKLTGYPNQPSSYALFKALAAEEDYSSAAQTAATTFRIEAGSSELLYNYGTDAVIPELRSFQRVTGSLPTLNATGALTAAMIVAGILTSSTAAAVAGTVPTGTVLDAAIQMNVGESLDFSVINTGAANAFTVTAATGVTIVGAAAVAQSTSGRFRLVKTAAATYVIYRLS